MGFVLFIFSFMYSMVSTIVRLFVSFLFATEFSVLLQMITTDCPFDIFKLFLNVYCSCFENRRNVANANANKQKSEMYFSEEKMFYIILKSSNRKGKHTCKVTSAAHYVLSLEYVTDMMMRQRISRLCNLRYRNVLSMATIAINILYFFVGKRV